MTRTNNLFVAAALAIATMTVAPAMAANNATDQARPTTQIKRIAMTHHQHRGNLRAREDESSMTRGNANTNANVSNANASAARPVESLATQYGAVTRSGNASDPVCKRGEMIQEMDGQMHPCQ